jgi:hypothetical protein
LKLPEDRAEEIGSVKDKLAFSLGGLNRALPVRGRGSRMSGKSKNGKAEKAAGNKHDATARKIFSALALCLTPVGGFHCFPWL